MNGAVQVIRDDSRLEAKGHFEIYTLEWMGKKGLFHIDQQERLKYFEIIWFRAGSGALQVDSKAHTISNNLVYFLTPGQLRHYQANDNYCGYYISFSKDFLYLSGAYTKTALWLESYGVNMNIPVIEADADMQNEMEQIGQKMKKEFSNYYLLRSEILSGLLNILMIHFSRKLQVGNDEMAYTKDAELVCNFKTLLKKWFITKKLVADYAKELCVTPNYLNRTVKKITGFTASHHIQQYIILEAKRQAIHSNVSMKEIAYFLGFDNLAHFSKFFKNNSGMNFTSFKKGLVYAD